MQGKTFLVGFFSNTLRHTVGIISYCEGWGFGPTLCVLCTWSHRRVVISRCCKTAEGILSSILFLFLNDSAEFLPSWLRKQSTTEDLICCPQSSSLFPSKIDSAVLKALFCGPQRSLLSSSNTSSLLLSKIFFVVLDYLLCCNQWSSLRSSKIFSVFLKDLLCCKDYF